MAVTDYTLITGKARKEYNVGGGTQAWYMCSRSKATAIPRPLDLTDAAATNPEDYVAISDPITFGAGDGFFKNFLTRDSLRFTTDSVTERDSSGFPIKVEFFVPGLNKEDLGNFQLAANDDLLVLIPTPDGKFLMVGSDQFAAELKYSFTLGENAKGGRGVKVTIEGFEVCPFIYTGTVTEKP